MANDAATNVGGSGKNNEITCGMMVVDSNAQCTALNKRAGKKLDISKAGIQKALNTYGFVEIPAYDGGIKKNKNKDKGTESR